MAQFRLNKTVLVVLTFFVALTYFLFIREDSSPELSDSHTYVKWPTLNIKHDKVDESVIYQPSIHSPNKVADHVVKKEDATEYITSPSTSTTTTSTTPVTSSTLPGKSNSTEIENIILTSQVQFDTELINLEFVRSLRNRTNSLNKRFNDSQLSFIRMNISTNSSILGECALNSCCWDLKKGMDKILFKGNQTLSFCVSLNASENSTTASTFLARHDDRRQYFFQNVELPKNMSTFCSSNDKNQTNLSICISLKPVNEMHCSLIFITDTSTSSILSFTNVTCHDFHITKTSFQPVSTNVTNLSLSPAK